MMVENGDADCMLSGYSKSYPSVFVPLIRSIGKAKYVEKVAATNLMITRKGPLFCSDTSLNINPSHKEIARITVDTARVVKNLGIEPVIAILSYSNFGSSDFEEAKKVSKAVEILHKKHPELIVDGPIQSDFALNREMLKNRFPFSILNGRKVNTLIFPNLDSANITYKIIKELDRSVSVGPILIGLNKPIHILQLGASVDEIVNMAAVSVIDANQRKIKKVMITYIKGRLIEKTPTKIIVECNGIGYDINISLNTYENIPDEENIKIFTYLQRKEDSDILFGFSSQSERSIFQQLISVSGIGPSTARTILSSISPSEIQDAVWSEDVDRIKSIKGIGLKTAQRLIIELKDKVELFDKKDIDLSGENFDIKKEALLALSVLGFSKSKAENVVSKVYFENKDIELQELIKKSLNKL